MSEHVFHLPLDSSLEAQVLAAQIATVNYALDKGGDPGGVFIGTVWHPAVELLTPEQGAVTGEIITACQS